MPSDDHLRLSRFLQSLVKILQELPEDNRRTALRDFVSDSLEICFDSGFHFSDFCESLADFAFRQADLGSGWPHPEINTWRNTALILQTAVQEAETEGRELP